MQRVVELNRGLKRYDRRLSAKYKGQGMIYILWADAQINKLVCALTDNWSVSGNPVPWGLLPILDHLREIDAAQRADLFNDIRKQRERKAESSERHFKNELEAGLKDNRKGFSKAFDDFNLSTCDKKKDKRRLKNGY